VPAVPTGDAYAERLTRTSGLAVSGAMQIPQPGH
jgi:hypothetical protein